MPWRVLYAYAKQYCWYQYHKTLPQEWRIADIKSQYLQQHIDTQRYVDSMKNTFLWKYTEYPSMDEVKYIVTLSKANSQTENTFIEFFFI
jgi:hypothetical protein